MLVSVSGKILGGIMRSKLHRAVLRRFLIRILGVLGIALAFWFVIPSQSLVEPHLSRLCLLGFGLTFLFGPAIWPRMQRLRMRLSAPRQAA